MTLYKQHNSQVDPRPLKFGSIIGEALAFTASR